MSNLDSQQVDLVAPEILDVSIINNLIAEQGYFLYPAVEIPEYGRFTVTISAPFDTQTGTFVGRINEEMSEPTEKYFDLKRALEESVRSADTHPHIIYVEIGEVTVALKIGQLAEES